MRKMRLASVQSWGFKRFSFCVALLLSSLLFVGTVASAAYMQKLTPYHSIPMTIGPALLLMAKK